MHLSSHRFAQANDLPAPKITVLPWGVIWSVGVFTRMVRELRSTRYQFSEAFIMESGRARTMFNQQAESLEAALRDAAKLLKGSKA
ncbi:hypothetical protein [Chelatococcus asaccharovorans]|uniref:hypothetical protein n=1 Tax=Chelatococcus asaccharovorans TaxID=28210 RepID=UPI00224C7860|nr:hypothetical protein [Chelatococcus asaccharovorans]CAH1674300.1 hypothetical protein CHELA17_61649 [Chelatococcus asaccharovorans]CAH1674316.1 hypothetical protein CHELA40_13978 [Chelatococcus asaccharovorans]